MQRGIPDFIGHVSFFPFRTLPLYFVLPNVTFCKKGMTPIWMKLTLF